MLAWRSFNAKPLKYRVVQGERGSIAQGGFDPFLRRVPICAVQYKISHRSSVSFHGACFRAAFGFLGWEGKAG